MASQTDHIAEMSSIRSTSQTDHGLFETRDAEFRTMLGSTVAVAEFNHQRDGAERSPRDHDQVTVHANVDATAVHASVDPVWGGCIQVGDVTLYVSTRQANEIRRQLSGE